MYKRFWATLLLAASPGLVGAIAAAAAPTRVIVVDFGKEQGRVEPRIGFLGGLRDTTPDAIVEPLHPSLWRIGHQFRGRISAALPGAIARVEQFGATYKLVMSDLIGVAKSGDYAAYEAAVKKLVAQVGTPSRRIIWEPVNEPDISYKPIAGYYELYSHAFKALREAEPQAQICGPGYAFPSYDKYRAFLNYCRANRLECNYLAWHYTGWDPAAPEKQNWHLGRLRELLKEYKEQRIREIHCDEWGAGPDKPGRLQPGRAVVWFYYLESVFGVDRACRANWGKQDDYLGGIITPSGEPLPVYHAYRYYGLTKGQMRAASEGNDDAIAALGSKSDDHYEVLLGSTANAPTKVTLDLKGLPANTADVQVRLIPASSLETPLTAENVPLVTDYSIGRGEDGLRITLGRVEENQVYHLRLRRPDVR
jgi:xylan 1,4-beta-xylosidase